MEGKTNPTERPPAREVLSAAIQEALALGLKPEGSLFASKLLAALAAAGYPVEAGPALVEAALAEYRKAVGDILCQHASGKLTWYELVQAIRDYKQEPAP